MTELAVRQEGVAGRITLNRPAALNALTMNMVHAMAAALDAWRDDPSVKLVIIDAAGDRAFCAGGDVATLHAQGTAGNFEPGREFWRAEYRLDAMIANYEKPIAVFMQGFTMGGGVGIACHASHRVTGESTRVAMPECSIGLVPDVGGSLLLAQAPGHAGEYLALTASHMTAADAIYAGFADNFVSETQWPAVKAELAETGDVDRIKKAASPPPPGTVAALRSDIDRLFGSGDLGQISQALMAGNSDFARDALARMNRNAPLAMAACLNLISEARHDPRLESSLTREYRYVFRSLDQGDFLEGIRARIVDKDNAPRWRHAIGEVPPDEVAAMLAPLGTDELTWEPPT